MPRAKADEGDSSMRRQVRRRRKVMMEFFKEQRQWVPRRAGCESAKPHREEFSSRCPATPPRLVLFDDDSGAHSLCGLIQRRAGSPAHLQPAVGAGEASSRPKATPRTGSEFE